MDAMGMEVLVNHNPEAQAPEAILDTIPLVKAMDREALLTPTTHKGSYKIDMAAHDALPDFDWSGFDWFGYRSPRP